MRKFIISLSILFYALSGIISIRALMIPDTTGYYQNNSLPPQAEKIEELTKEQEASKALVEKLQTTITQLENKLSDKQIESPAKVESSGSRKDMKVLAVLDGKMFNTGYILMDDNLMNSIKKIIPDILAFPDHRVSVEGHTDNIPIKSTSDKQYRDNMDLSFLRAKTVAGVLIEHGISRDRISVIGYGDTRPLASNGTDEGRAKNRRVEIKLITEGKES